MGASQSHESPIETTDLLQSKVMTQDLQNSKKIKGLVKVMSAKERKEKEMNETYRTKHDDDYDVTKTNQQLLKALYKKMDPMVLKVTGDVKGEVQLSFKYNFDRELLLVKVIRCRDLDPKDVRGKTADPFVRLFLHPSDTDEGDRRTQIVKRTLSPAFNEIFSFNIPELALMDTKLIAQVCDYDDVMKHDVFGEAVIALKQIQFHENPVHTAWYSLQLETDFQISGDIEVTMAYQLPQSLLVTVHRGSNLTQRDREKMPETMVKITIPGIPVVHTTKPIKDTVDPEWDETFEFPIPQEEFVYRYILFNVHDKAAGSSCDESIGQVIIDLINLDPERGYTGTFALSDMKNHDRLRNKLSQKVTVQEFRESLMAHSLFRQPKFLFQKHTGNKVITVTSRKAGTNARIRLLDGIPI